MSLNSTSSLTGGGSLIDYIILFSQLSSSHWVMSACFAFRCMAYAVFAPVAFLCLLDIVAYVIGRTIGTSKSHTPKLKVTTFPISVTLSLTPSSPTTPITPPSSPETSSPPTISTPSNVKPLLSIPVRSPGFPTAYFATPSESNFALTGLFSPPGSRPPSPVDLTGGKNSRSRAGSLSERSRTGSVSGLIAFSSISEESEWGGSSNNGTIKEEGGGTGVRKRAPGVAKMTSVVT